MICFIKEIFDKFDILRKGVINFNSLKNFYSYAISDQKNYESEMAYDETVKKAFKGFLEKNFDITLNKFRSFFLHLSLKQKNIVYDILTKFGYKTVVNCDCRHFFLSFHTNELLDLRISDGLNTKFNNYAFELFLRNLGTLSRETSNQINLYTALTE